MSGIDAAEGAARTPPPPDIPRLRRSLQRIAWLMDEMLRIPGTQLRVGLDAVIGFVPILGDFGGFLVGLWMVSQSRSCGAPADLQKQMLRNLFLELVVGAVPLLGDMFDIAFRANSRNRALVEEWLAKHEPPVVVDKRRRLWPMLLLGVGLGLVGYWLSQLLA